MSQRQTSQNGADASMSSLEASLVNLSLTPGGEEARKMTATSGRSLSALLPKCGPLGSLVRMLLESQRWSSQARLLSWEAKPLYSRRTTLFTDTDTTNPSPLNASAQILNSSDMQSNRCLFRLVPSEPPHRRDRVFFIAYSEDAMHLRCSKREDEERINSGEHRNTGTGDTERHGCEERVITSDTEKQRGQRVRPQQRETCGEEQVELGGSRGEDEYSDERKIRWTDADTHLNGMEGNIQPGDSREPQQGFLTEKPSDGYRSLQKEYRWRNFPTVSPVHRGNDGIPFPLDCLTISPNKWRTESLKAYGNAIVPQVMYEIFRAIELTH